MKSLELISAFWKILFPKSSNSPHLHDTDSIERKVVARFSRGNIRLQQGQYWTHEETEEGLKRARENARKYGD